MHQLPVHSASFGRWRQPNRRLQLDRRQVELVAPLERGQRDREVLDRQAGRVEGRDLVRPSAARRPRRRARRRARSPARARASRPRPRATSSPLWLACSQSSQKTCVRTSSSTAISALPGPSAPIRLTCCPGRSEPGPNSTSCPGVTVTTTSAASASSREPATAAPSSSAAARGARLVDVPEQHGAPRRDERPRRGAAVDAGADHRRACPAGRASPPRARPRRRSAAPSPRRRRRPRPASRSTRRRAAPARSPSAALAPGCPGNDVTHFSSAWPPPSAGIARKSPAG